MKLKCTSSLRMISKYIQDSISVHTKFRYLVKADRVNAIRKQYEAYLEEDKKRKERNEYILGKLDKMRTCTNVVQHKYQSNHLVGVQHPILYKKNTSVVERPTSDVSPNRPVSNLCIDVARNAKDDLLIKEIVSNYILIPKRHPSTSADTDTNCYAHQRPRVVIDRDTNPNVDDTADNNDWRSKYEILNKLKRKEKGELDEDTPEIFKTNDNNSKIISENRSVAELPQSTYDYSQDIRSDHDERPNNAKCEENHRHFVDLSIEQNKKSVNGTKYFHVPQTVDTQPLEVSDNRLTTSESAVKTSLKLSHVNLQSQEDANLNRIPQLTEESTVVTNNDRIKELPEQIILTAEEELIDCIENNIDLSQAPYSESNKNNETFTHGPKYSDDTEIPAHVIQTQELETIQNDNVNPNEYGYDHSNLAFSVDPDSSTGANHEESDNMNSNVEPSTAPMPEHTEDFDATANVAGIAAFEEEQNNLFYQEPSQNESLHDQLAVGDTYQQLDENYQQNQQYYYEGQEQTYPVEINEHEETQQPYDQNYVQQYSENYGNTYEQQHAYEEQPTFEQHQEYDGQQGQVYEEQQELDQTQHYEQQAYDPIAYQEGYQQPGGFEQYQEPIYDEQYQTENNETVQEIEENLDKEEGYVAPQAYQNTSQHETEKEIEKTLSPN